MSFDSPPQNRETQHQQNREVLRQSQARRAAMQTERFITTGSSEDFAQAQRSWQQVEQRVHTPRTKEQMLDDLQQILTPERLSSLPTLPRNLEYDNESRKLADIKEALQNTRKGEVVGRTYIRPTHTAIEINRWKIEQDLVWLRDSDEVHQTERSSTRTGPNAIPKRRNVFEAYSQILAELTLLYPPQEERAFISSRRGSILACRENLEHMCRDPENIRGAGKFGLMLVLGGIALAYGINDIMRMKEDPNALPSIGTMGLVGALALLASSGSKFSFMGSDSFARLSRGPLNKEAVTKLQRLAKQSPTAFRHLLAELNEAVTRKENLDDAFIQSIVHPTKTVRGHQREDRSRKISADIAELFRGQSPSDVLYVLQGIKRTASSRDKRVIAESAEALGTRDPQVSRDLERLVTQTSS